MMVPDPLTAGPRRAHFGILLRLALSLVAAWGAVQADPVVPPVRPIPKIPFTLDDLKAQKPQNREGNFLLEVPDIANSDGDQELQNVLAGQTVETTGQVMSEGANSPGANRLRIVRTMIVCCALHPRQYAVVLEFPGKAPDFKELSWVKVIGAISYKEESGKAVPIVLVREIKEIPAPKALMLQ